MALLGLPGAARTNRPGDCHSVAARLACGRRSADAFRPQSSSRHVRFRPSAQRAQRRGGEQPPRCATRSSGRERQSRNVRLFARVQSCRIPTLAGSLAVVSRHAIAISGRGQDGHRDPLPAHAYRPLDAVAHAGGEGLSTFAAPAAVTKPLDCPSIPRRGVHLRSIPTLRVTVQDEQC